MYGDAEGTGHGVVDSAYLEGVVGARGKVVKDNM